MDENKTMTLMNHKDQKKMIDFKDEFDSFYTDQARQTTKQITQNLADEEKKSIVVIKHLRNLWRELPVNGINRIAIFGAGKHTAWLETVLKDIPASPQIIAVFDDNPNPKQKMWNLIAEKPVTVASNRFEAIILSTDSIPDVFAARCRAIWGNVKLIDLYKHLPQGPYFKLPDVCKDLYIQTKHIRMVEEEIAKRYHEQKMRCPVHLSVGQEASAVGVCSALTKDDFVMSGHRAHAHYLAKGGCLKKMLAEIYGKSTGCCAGKGGSMHLIDNSVGFKGSTAIVGGTIPLAVGLGLSLKIKNSTNIACIFLGDGAVEEGVFYEAINFAVLKRLPVLFVCENNNFSVYSHINKRQPAERKIFEMVKAMGCSAAYANGNNALAVYDLAKRVITDIRQGAGPWFIELATYRWREHCGPNYDHDLNYRNDDEFDYWQGLDPVLWLEFRMLEQQLFNANDVKAIEANLSNEINQAFDFAINSPFPAPETAFEKIYKGGL